MLLSEHFITIYLFNFNSKTIVFLWKLCLLFWGYTSKDKRKSDRSVVTLVKYKGTGPQGVVGGCRNMLKVSQDGLALG